MRKNSVVLFLILTSAFAITFDSSGATSIISKDSIEQPRRPNCNEIRSVSRYVKCTNSEKELGFARKNRFYGAHCVSNDYTSLIGKHLGSPIYYPLNAEIYYNSLPRQPTHGLSVALNNDSVVVDVACF